MKTIVIFGGSGGLGTKVVSWLRAEMHEHQYYDKLISVSSKDVDIINFNQVYNFFEGTKADVVINLTGINYDTFIHKMDKRARYSFDDMIDVNIRGSVNIASACLPGMRERGYGRLIYISSILSTKVVLGTGLYSSCKAFIDRLVKNISAENIGKGVTCNSIQCGYMDGGLTYKVPDYEKVKESLPLKRWGTIEELCNTIEYIINTEYLTGTSIPLNGGI